MSNLISNDLRINVNHPYLMLGCQYEIDPKLDFKNRNYKQPNKFWKDLNDADILKKYSGDGSEYVYEDAEMKYLEHREYSHWPCSVLKEEDPIQGRYTVQIHQTPLKGGYETRKTAWANNNVPRILTNYSQESIHYFIKPNAQDHQLPGAFRHHIGLPPGIYPEHWLNYKNNNTEE